VSGSSLSRFACYLSEEQGLSAATLRIDLPFVQRFLRVCFGQGRLDLERLCAHEVTRFVLDPASRLKPPRAKLMVTALRRSLFWWGS
jgi:hypothetical protein